MRIGLDKKNKKTLQGRRETSTKPWTYVGREGPNYCRVHKPNFEALRWNVRAGSQRSPTGSIISLAALLQDNMNSSSNQVVSWVRLTLLRAATLCASSASTSGSVSALRRVCWSFCSASSSRSCSCRFFSSVWWRKKYDNIYLYKQGHFGWARESLRTFKRKKETLARLRSPALIYGQVISPYLHLHSKTSEMNCCPQALFCAKQF